MPSLQIPFSSVRRLVDCTTHDLAITQQVFGVLAAAGQGARSPQHIIIIEIKVRAHIDLLHHFQQHSSRQHGLAPTPTGCHT